MLKGIDPILTPDLLRHLCAMGHGEWVAIVDANFTAEGLAAQRIALVRLPGLDLKRVTQAILSVFPLDRALERPVAFMQHAGLRPGETTPSQDAFIAEVERFEGIARSQVEAVERFEFYRRTERARLIVQTGEATAYGNAMLAKGVILP
jgi:L-fucose mutarotase